jgi:hypothetical protein
MRSWSELLPAAGPAVDNIRWRLTWSEWRAAQGQAPAPAHTRLTQGLPADAESALPTPFDEAVRRRLVFMRWLYETGRLIP